MFPVLNMFRIGCIGVKLSRTVTNAAAFAQTQRRYSTVSSSSVLMLLVFRI